MTEESGESGEPILACVDDYERLAEELLPRMVFDYYAGGAGEEWTLRENRAAFARWALRPRVLVDVSSRDLSTSVLGTPVALPILVAPTAIHRMAHPEGEVATARAAARAGTIMTLSTLASATIEEVAEAAPEGARWFQLYVHRDRGLTEDLVARAVAAGYRAIVLTVDTPMLGIRDRDTRNRYTTPEGITMANLATRLPQVDGSGLFAYMAERHEAALSWPDLEWLRSLFDLPLVLKGVMTHEDARLAVDHGVDAIVVSNHGGRQLDGVLPTLEALPEVVEGAAGRLEVLMDGGIRRGSHVLKALALGARAVLVGRPVLWGLAVAGEEGVAAVLEILRAELDNALAIVGCPRVRDVEASLVARRA
jgi:4-hydroxymandelate oxidase